MGEALARFRDLASAIRRKCDERHSQPRLHAVQSAAAKRFAKECRIHLLEYEKAGMPYSGRYIRGLLRLRDAAERHREPSPPGHLPLPDYIGWLPDGREPAASEFRAAFRAAVREAVQWGSLFPVVEERLKALSSAAERLSRYAAPRCHEDPNPEYYEEAEDGEWYRTGPTFSEADRDYITRHEEFAEAFDALAPFVGEPPTAAAATSEKQPGGSRGRGGRNRKGIGGRPEMYPAALVRKVVAAREKYEKNQKRLKQRILPRSQWLFDFCGDEGIDTRSTFPSKDPQQSEAWDVRSERFWRAARKRLRKSGH